MTEHRMDARDWAMLLLLSLVWGVSFFFFKILGTELPPFTLVLGRVAIAAAALHLLLVMRGTPLHIPRASWGRFLLLGLLSNAIPFCLIAFGETRIASGLAAILNATTPLFTILVAHIFTAEKVTAPKLAGLALGLCGVALLIGPDALGGLAGDLVGESACLLAAFTYGLALVYGRGFRAMRPLDVATGQLTASALLLIAPAMLIDRPWALAPPSAQAWVALIAFALVSTAFAYLLYFRLVASAGATNLSLVTFLAPVTALLLGAALLGEAVTLHALAGMALIGLSLAAIDGRLWARLRRPAA